MRTVSVCVRAYARVCAIVRNFTYAHDGIGLTICAAERYWAAPMILDYSFRSGSSAARLKSQKSGQKWPGLKIKINFLRDAFFRVSFSSAVAAERRQSSG